MTHSRQNGANGIAPRLVDIRYARATEGGACGELAPGVAAKYFTSDDAFKQRTAKAICGHCPIQQRCLELAIKSGPVRDGTVILRYGVLGGMTTAEIGRIQEWEAFDRWETDTPPTVPRVQRYVAPRPKRHELSTRPDKPVPASFEEQVYVIFKDAKEGKYPNLNAAIADIARLHEAVLLREQGVLGKGSKRIRNAGTHTDGRRR